MDDKKRAILDEIPRLRRYARALLHDREAADDLVHDGLERALSQLDDWQSGESPRQWLLTIIHSLFIDRKRRPARRGEELPPPHEMAEGTVPPPARFESAMSRELFEALQAIAPERREALLLVAVEGLTYGDAASVLGIPTETLLSRIAAAREELRASLDDAARRRMIRIVEK